MKKLVTIVASLVAMFGIALAPLLPTTVYAAVTDATTCTGADNQVGCGACLAEKDAKWSDPKTCTRPNGGSDLNGIIHTIINIMLFIVGTLSVVMIIFGGIRYTTSTGDKGRVDSAKNTIVYAVVGLVVSIIAFALVQWVFSSLQK